MRFIVIALWACEQLPQVLTVLYCIDAFMHGNSMYSISDLFATFVGLSGVISRKVWSHVKGKEKGSV